MKKIVILALLTLSILACSKKEPPVSTLKKDKAIEISYETQRLGDTAVLLLTHQNVYVKGQLIRSQIKRDTLPALGDTIQTLEVDGEEQTKRLPKEYEFFVTVK